MKEKVRLYSTSYLYLIYLRRYNQGNPLNFDKFFYKFNRIFIIVFGAYICNVDPMGRYGGQYPQTDARDKQSIQDIPRRSEFPDRLCRSRKQSCPSSTINRKLLFKWLIPTASMQRSSWTRKLKVGWISYAVLGVYLVLFSVVLADVAFLYEYDISRLRLKRVQDLFALVGRQGRILFDRSIPADNIRRGTQMTLGDFERILVMRMSVARQTLSYLGDRFISWGVVNVSIYVSILLLGVVIYICFQGLYLFVNEPDFQFQHDLIDYEGEQRRVDALCESAVFKYLESYCAHANSFFSYRTNASETLQWPYAYLFSRYSQVGRPNFTREPGQEAQSKRPEVKRPHRKLPGLIDAEKLRRSDADADEDSTRCLLMQMLSAGALRPLNRSNAWIRKRNIIQFTLQFCTLTYCVLFDVGALYWVFKSSEPSQQDLALTCALMMMIIHAGSIVYYLTTFVLPCFDQLMQVNHLLQLISDCISLNKRQFHLMRTNTQRRVTTRRSRRFSPRNFKIKDEEQEEEEESQFRGWQADERQRKRAIVDRMNSNLLFVLMSYKIFVEQLKPFRRALRGIFLMSFSVSFIVPVLARIHVPYLNRDIQTIARLFELIISSVVLIPVNFFCVPMCYVHSRCERLFKAMSSLMAHITEVRSSHSLGESELYSEHAVKTLAKELSDSRLMLEQFVVHSLGLGGTFPTLVKLHFWWGLVALSILIDSRQGYHNEFLTTLFSDPLGVWCFHLV